MRSRVLMGEVVYAVQDAPLAAVGFLSLLRGFGVPSPAGTSCSVGSAQPSACLPFVNVPEPAQSTRKR